MDKIKKNRILLINDYLLYGGAEIYTLNLKKILEEENEVYLLTFDNNFKNNIAKMDDKKNIINIKPNKGMLKLINKIFYNPILAMKIRKKVNEIKPDKIILNNLFYAPITQMKALKKYEVYQVIHDYSVVCPKSTCIKENFEKCKGYKKEKCMKKCKYHNSKVNLYIKLYLTKRLEKIRKKIVKKNIAPSQHLNKYLLDFGYNSICINNPIDISKFKFDKNCDNTKKRFIYVGNVSKIKGIYKFLEYFNIFSKDKNVKLDIIGKIKDQKDEKILEEYIKENKKINYLGIKSYQEVLKELSSSDFIIVPSIWIENYPTTVLEGMLSKTLVLASNRGGMEEMLESNRGMIFDIFNEESVIGVLEKAFKLSKDNYKEITEKAYKYAVENNNFSIYKQKIYNILEEK